MLIGCNECRKSKSNSRTKTHQSKRSPSRDHFQAVYGRQVECAVTHSQISVKNTKKNVKKTNRHQKHLIVQPIEHIYINEKLLQRKELIPLM